MYFIFMLTRDDRTVADCLEVIDRVLPLGLQHIGFKDIGVEPETLALLTKKIRVGGATSYLEVVSETPEAALQSAQMAVRLGVDRLLGGTDVAPTLEILAGSGVAYYPFPGRPKDHPTLLGGSPAEVAEDCRRFMAAGAAGVDLLAYRATEAEPMALIEAARDALDTKRSPGAIPGELIIAGSIDSPARIAGLRAAGVDGFTIGSAIFDDSFAPETPGLIAQIESVLAAVG